MANLPELCLGPHDHEFCFFTVKFEEVGGHPDLYCLKAVDYGLGGGAERLVWCLDTAVYHQHSSGSVDHVGG